MKRTNLLVFILTTLLLSSCVSKKKFNDLTLNSDHCKNELSKAKKALSEAELESKNDKERIESLVEEIDFFKQNYTNLLDRLSDMSVLSKAQAESVKKSLEKIDDQAKYIRELTTAAQKKDSINIALLTNLKRSLGAYDDSGDIEISVKKGVVYVSISDKLLFSTGSYNVTPKAKELLSKVAEIINKRNDIEVLVEGHTDPIPYASGVLLDNWDLSVKRATSVVRILQNDYKVAPVRLTAAGRAEYLPKASNDSPQGRSENRRTEIILIPLIDQFFELSQPQE